MTTIYNEHLNPRSYRTAQHVKFHIQNERDVPGVALCGGICPPHSFSIFSPTFVLRLDLLNQCPDCVKEQHELEHLAQSADSRKLLILTRKLS